MSTHTGRRAPGTRSRAALLSPPPPPTTTTNRQEQGWNGIHFNQVANGWIRDVRIENSDMGVYFW